MESTGIAAESSTTATWTTEDVCAFLDSLSLAASEECSSTFRSEFVDGKTLLKLSVDDMRSMGLNMHDAKLIFESVCGRHVSPQEEGNQGLAYQSPKILFQESFDTDDYYSITQGTLCLFACLLPTPRSGGRSKLVVTETELEMSLGASQSVAGLYTFEKIHRTNIRLDRIGSVEIRSASTAEEHMVVNTTQVGVKPILIAGIRDLHRLKEVLGNAGVRVAR